MTAEPAARHTDDDAPPPALCAVPAGLAVTLFGAAGLSLLGGAYLLVLNRSDDVTLHTPIPRVAWLFLLGAGWLLLSAGLLRRAPWARYAVVGLGLLDIGITATVSLTLELAGRAGPPLHRLGPALLCVLLAHPAFRRVLAGPGSPMPGRPYVTAVAWGTVLFLALGAAGSMGTMLQQLMGREPSGWIFAAGHALGSPVVSPMVLPFIVLAPLPLAGIEGRRALLAVHVVGAVLAVPVIVGLFQAALSIGR